MRSTLRSWLQLSDPEFNAGPPQALQTVQLPESPALHTAEGRSAPLYSGAKRAGFRQYPKLPLSTESVFCRVFTVRADPSIEPACVGLNSVQRKVSFKGSITICER